MAIGRVAAEGTAQYMSGPYEFIDLDAGHWIIQEAFDKVVEPITVHLKRNGVSGSVTADLKSSGA